MSETKHPIQIVSRRTGLSTDVIRAWERRYKAVKPIRSSNGRRLYSDNDVKKLMLLQRIISGGRRIGDIAKLNIQNLEDLIHLICPIMVLYLQKLWVRLLSLEQQELYH